MLHVPGYQRDWLYGDVAATFDANALDAVDMNRGDKVLYVTDGDGVVQSVINVTESKMRKSYDDTTDDGSYPGVYSGDDHTTSDEYTNTYTLLSLWKDIADDQIRGAAPTTVTFFGKTFSVGPDGNITGKVTFNEAAENDADTDVSVDNGKLVMWNGNNVTSSTDFDLNVLEGGASYTGVVLGDNGEHYDVALTQDGKINGWGDVYSTNNAIAVVRPNTHLGTIGNGVDGRWVTYEIEVTDPEQLIISNLENILAASEGCTISDFKAYDQTFTLANPGTPIAENQTCATAVFFQMNMVNKYGSEVLVTMYRDPTISNVTDTYTVTIPNYATSGIKAYWNWPDKPVPESAITMSGTDAVITVKNGMYAITLAADGLGEGTWAQTGGVTGEYWHEDENTSTLVLGINNANVTGVTFTPDNAPPALSALVADALVAKSFKVIVPSSETAPDNAAILTAIKAKITEDLGAEAAALITAVTNTTNLTGATTAGATVRDQRVTVTVDGTAGKVVNSVEFTLLYTEVQLKTAVDTALATGPSVATNDTIDKLTAAIVDMIEGVNGVSDVSISNLTQTGNATTGLVVGAIYGFDWTLTYNNETVTGSAQVTLQA